MKLQNIKEKQRRHKQPDGTERSPTKAQEFVSRFNKINKRHKRGDNKCLPSVEQKELQI